jgi:hypothetical protein
MTAEIFGICLVAATRSDFVADVSVRVPQKAYIPEAFPCFLPKPSLPCARLRLATIRTKRTYGAVTQCASVQNRSRPARRHTHTHPPPSETRQHDAEKHLRDQRYSGPRPPVGQQQAAATLRLSSRPAHCRRIHRPPRRPLPSPGRSTLRVVLRAGFTLLLPALFRGRHS